MMEKETLKAQLSASYDVLLDWRGTSHNKTFLIRIEKLTY
jgi:hypothetical protein